MVCPLEGCEFVSDISDLVLFDPEENGEEAVGEGVSQEGENRPATRLA
jgi:hypothetical protein